MAEPISLSNYNPISNLELQYAEPLGQRVLVFVKASQECCIDVESVLKFQSKRGGSALASSAANAPPFAAPADVEETAGTGDAADDPFAFLNSDAATPSATNAGDGSRSGGHSLKKKLLSKVKATTKHIERGMTTMAIKADKGRSRDSYQCVLQDGLGQSWSATDFQAESTDDGLVFRIPLVVWPWLDREGSVVISLFVKSGAALLKQHKPHKLGSIHLTMIDLMAAATKPNANGAAFLTQSLDSNFVHGGQMQLCFLRDNKFTPGPQTRGWSVTDPGMQGYNALFRYPLDQSYLYNKGPGQWPIATERAVESSVVLPLAAAYAQLVERASVISMSHAGSVLNSIFENRHDSPSKCNNKANVKVGVYHMLVNDASVPVTAAVSVHWQRPDCVFEVEIAGDTRLPVYTADANYFDQSKAPTLFSEFYAKMCRNNILPAIVQGYARVQKPLPAAMLGNLSLRVRVSTTSSVSGADNPFGPVGTGTQAISASEDYWQATIGLETLLNNSAGQQKPPGPLQVPLYHLVSGKSMGSLILTMQVQGPAEAASVSQMTPSTGGLVSLVGLDTLTEETGAAPFLDFEEPAPENAPQDPNKVLRRQQFSTMGHFISSMYLEQHIQKVRTPDCDEADDKAVHYNKALVQPYMDTPSHQDKTPKPFRPSSSRIDKLVAGIGFNVHVQSLSFNMHNDDVQQQPLQGGWFHNITCGAPADHAKGFGDILATDKKSSKTSNSASTSNNTPVGAIKGGLRRLEQKRVELAKVLEEAQSALIQAVGQYLKTANERGVHQIPARHGTIAPLRWKVFELTQMLHTVTWHCAVRRSHVFSQALGIAISSYLTAVSDSDRAAKGWPSLWAQHGYLVTFEGLLSAAGKELGMIEDASIGISMLRMVTVVLVSVDASAAQREGNVEATCNQSQKVPVAYSPNLLYVRMSCSGKGSSTQYRLEIGLDPNYYAERIPEALKNGVPVRLFPVLYQVGVDIRQWGAHAGQNAKNNLKNQINNATSSGPDVATTQEEEKANAGGLLDDEDDDAGVPDNDELIALNYEGFRKMNVYANMIAPQTPGETLLENFPGNDDSNNNAHQNVHPLLRHLYSNIMASAGKMAHGILDEAAMVAQKLGGGGVVFCKSGKDRTAMHVTYKAAQYVRLFCKDPPDEVYEDATMMRVYGTRLPICEKNVGQAKYAFNSLQVKFMPDVLKPPMNTLAGFLKGGAVFRGGGIES
mmetsp:Transcript_835/g.1327  ORF Transcript_835/g.1327 Transcript_835/m.1327 type:complete len:1214 (-) Transcript_835:218-3859(-)|eukprot:CAMPEP_0195281618 /NCGR_PEP_ID=MMETSP0707-20130614/852_1 /TAXON_ID=33640 /ORGANISM="Asterionellopsis glacialis, Strain CCMP134" /LENGTH=1213 /DNA_ID=CAMNT_0040340523 /DNA_START=140 /DNA_END=3781 /DNA_ORIENTATION=-